MHILGLRRIDQGQLGVFDSDGLERRWQRVLKRQFRSVPEACPPAQVVSEEIDSMKRGWHLLFAQHEAIAPQDL